MKKVLAFLKKYWQAFIALVKKDEFKYSFPLTVFALSAFVLWSMLFTVVTVIWGVVIIVNTNEE